MHVKEGPGGVPCPSAMPFDFLGRRCLQSQPKSLPQGIGGTKGLCRRADPARCFEFLELSFLWLLVAELISTQGKSLSQLVGERMAAAPCSGEINYAVNDATAVIEAEQEYYAEQNPKVNTTDGISLEFADWCMSLCASNAEPLLRLTYRILRQSRSCGQASEGD
ncbi:hypothetical protein [Pseudomonas paeninsulae]|uniref:hypothetical protein n=1 Tax=Pseudomonas paeninsulae TaxID=3110772 RepID=UPI002D794881|nr:hypothetical protein [Pseudomonas sp. IT1137]